TRTRDPARKEKILAAAALLVARDGYHAASMADIGAEAGITGSGIYRHFDSKAAILVALFERVIDDLLTDEQRIVESQPDLAKALDLLIDGQVEFVVGTRAIAQVYHHEIASLPAEDRSRLRRKQRLYVEDWVHLVRELRRDLDDVTARTLVHAAISAIQSTLFHNVGLPEERLREVLAASARAVLTV
ncbi:MAG: TetR family transcriptional regulator, partial [Nocardioidaceae bacterium]|nr:TetR family transcriptional regulator [Nocardioidaceae bacterium]